MDQSSASVYQRRSVPLLKSNGVPGDALHNATSKPDNDRVDPREERSEQSNLARLLSYGVDVTSASIPVFVSWGLVVGLIFGGCCSNVFALEAIVKKEPESGLLITFTQFLVTYLFTLPGQLSSSSPPFFLKKRAVPLIHWMPATLMFFTVNMMNNFAFGYQISVPVHIILRSGGSVTTMFVGCLWGKKYNKGQVFGVLMLTVGVVLAALADAQSKGKMEASSTNSSTASFMAGLAILFVAQLLSAIMGLYVQLTYSRFGPHWQENLFYSHFLSLPLFAPFFPTLRRQLHHLINSTPITFQVPNPLQMLRSFSDPDLLPQASIQSWSLESKIPALLQLEIPIHVLNLALNSLTQYACIRGVNLLGARTSALGVTVVLNLRKLVSLFASIWLFGNDLPVGVSVGAAIVFFGAGVYAWAGQAPRKAKKG